MTAFEAQVRPLQAGIQDNGNPIEAKGWWLYRFVNSPYPLQERMTLFWHDHFATSNAKVRNLRLMWRQNETLRRHAIGHFDELLQAITRDPAMILWLDSSSNRKGAANENYARELMELFSLGIGHYTEADIQQAARALTGWSVKDEQGVFDLEKHDATEKTVFGQTGRFTAGDVVRMCLNRPACSLYIVRKLVLEFVSEIVVLSDALLEPLAYGFKARDYDLGWLVETILTSKLFYSAVAYQQKVKGPYDYVLGLVRALEGKPSYTQLSLACDQLGQSLFYPPSVKGWDGGAGWINSTTMLKRQGLVYELTRGRNSALRAESFDLIQKYQIPQTPVAATEFFLQLFHQRVEVETRDQIVRQLEDEGRKHVATFGTDQVTIATLPSRTAAHLALMLPEYQLA